MKKVLVVFDCFGVLADGVVWKFLEGKTSKDEIDRLTRTICIDGDLGKITREEFIGETARTVGMTPDEVEAEYKSLCTLHSDLISVIERIRSFADVAILSNAPFGHGEMVVDGFNIRHLFDKIFFSCHYGMAKPDPRFYTLCIESFDTEYDEIYMVDDSDKNLVPLKDLGIIPVKYTSPHDVETALQKYL